jgi:hypothetical protein
MPAKTRKPTMTEAKRAARFDRGQTCIHEAGHAVACVVFGIGLEFVSIRPGIHFRGLTSHDPAPLPDTLRRGGVLDQSIEFRTAVERQMVMVMAGPLAARMFDPASWSGYGVTDDEQAVRALTAFLAERIPLAQALAGMEAGDPLPSDDDVAYALSKDLAGEPDEAGAHHMLVRAASRRFVAEYWRPIEALAHVLNKRLVIDGPEAERIIRTAMAGARR